MEFNKATMEKINEISNFMYESINKLDSKATLQKVKGRIKLLNYKQEEIKGLIEEDYSIYSLTGNSNIDEIYSFNVSFISNEFLNIDLLLDTDVEIIIEDLINLRIKKNIFGKICKIEEDSIVAKKYMYKIEVVHPLYYLNFTNKYEIFQNKKFEDIIYEIIQRYSALLNTSLEIRIDKDKTPIREYTTQYNQSDLDFIMMLAQTEGYNLIFDYSNNQPYKVILCQLNDYALVNPVIKSISNFNIIKKFNATSHIEDYYDYNRPSKEYKINSNVYKENEEENPNSKQLQQELKVEKLKDKLNLLNESYYEDLTRYSNIDSLRETSKIKTIKAYSKEIQLKDSLLVELYDDKVNKSKEVIILGVKYKAYFPNALDEYTTLNQTLQYEVEVTCIPKEIIYKPNKTIKQTKIYGIQTAIVSNNENNLKEEENNIDVDEQGRVRVVFHFERNKTTSCYLRVSNISSGNNYGSMFIPRVNSEVIVSFINGDPDKPIIIGSLYNGENKIAHSLPNNKTKSYIRTYTTPQYEDEIGFNEILFEDKQGEEELNIKAQRDMNSLIQNDETRIVKHNQKIIIENDKIEDIKRDSKIIINNEQIVEVKSNSKEKIEKDKELTVEEDYDINVNKNLNLLVNDNLNIYTENNLISTIKNILHIYVEKDKQEKFLQNLYQEVVKDFGLEIDNDFYINSKEIKKEVHKEVNLNGKEEIVLRCGNNSISINSSGIYFHTLNFNSNSAYDGIVANNAQIVKSLFNLDFEGQ
ncbi:type VI secretion system, syringe needle protein [Arcobacter defluvii]|uniref:Type VI secretion system, syringe needle protein n=3 Tax=Arcobacter TaxID=28196 RepID=A0AAE7BHV3_9BACT|nr:type VI secretion system tip protein TssI/VgrG [Arcobacter defluvii]QKF78256.1 type VI secretion system, syringe needle protein [Arcobacter defluvii]